MSSFLRRFFSGATIYSTANMDAAKAQAVKLIQENKIMVFSKIGCPFCLQTKTLLKNTVGADGFKVLEVAGYGVTKEDADIATALKDSDVFNAKELEEEHGLILLDKGGRNHWTWPNVWIDKKQIGGNDDLTALIKNMSPEEIKALKA